MFELWYFCLSVKFCYNSQFLIEYAPVAQLDRVSDFESEGRKFESCRVYQLFTK